VSRFLQVYHGLDPQVEGARTVSWFWGLMTAGCLFVWNVLLTILGKGQAAEAAPDGDAGPAPGREVAA